MYITSIESETLDETLHKVITREPRNANNKKGEDAMSTPKLQDNTNLSERIMKRFMPQKIKDDRIAICFDGKIAVKRADGDFVSYDSDTNTIMNQMDFVINDSSLSKFLFLIPIPSSSLKVGDIIYNNGHYYAIKSISPIVSVDLESQTSNQLTDESCIALGTKTYFVVKSLFDGEFLNGSSENPMGNMIFLSMMGSEDLDMKSLLMLSALNGKECMNQNALLPLALLKDKNDDDNSDMGMLLMMSMMNGQEGNIFGNLFGHQTLNTSAQPTLKRNEKSDANESNLEQSMNEIREIMYGMTDILSKLSDKLDPPIKKTTTKATTTKTK